MACIISLILSLFLVEIVWTWCAFNAGGGGRKAVSKKVEKTCDLMFAEKIQPLFKNLNSREMMLLEYFLFFYFRLFFCVSLLKYEEPQGQMSGP